MKGIALILVVILVLVVALVPISAIAAPKLVDYRPVDVGAELRGWELNPDYLAAAAGEAGADASQMAPGDYPCYVESRPWWSLDYHSRTRLNSVFYLIAESGSAELWVQADLSWPSGDTRPTPVVTCEQAAYLVSEFDNNIYPTEMNFFGPPDLHDGSEVPPYVDPDLYYDQAGRQVILVSNIRDDNYYNSEDPEYIAGFYSPSFEDYFDRNIISIDVYDWANRVGPDGSQPYLYEGTFAHEYQHLLHDDWDPNEESWINEGLSTYAEYLTGYAHKDDQYSAFLEKPENSLVAWWDQGEDEIAADNGLVYLFHIYLLEQLGPEFLQHEFMNPDHGIASINSSLDALGIDRDFADIYHDFAVAVLIDSKHGDYRYGFEELDLKIDIGKPGQPNPEAYDTPGAPPWGTDYIWIKDPKELSKITFNGLDYNILASGWSSDGQVLWSGTGDLLDNWAIFTATVGSELPELTFDARWDLEGGWDFGFVQVSIDGGYSWTSLASAQTTYHLSGDAYPKVAENLPGLTGLMMPNWVPLSYDLSAYAGQDILIGFRLVTDWTTSKDGWWVDNIHVGNTLIWEGSNSEDQPFRDITQVLPINNNFTVTFVGHMNKGRGNQVKVLTMCLDEVTEEGMLELRSLLKGSKTAVMLVTFDAPEGYDGYAEYSYELIPRGGGPKKPK